MDTVRTTDGDEVTITPMLLVPVHRLARCIFFPVQPIVVERPLWDEDAVVYVLALDETLPSLSIH